MKFSRSFFVLAFLSIILVSEVGGQDVSPSATPEAASVPQEPSRITVYGRPLEAELPVLEATSATRLPALILNTDRSISVINRESLEIQQIDDPQQAIKDVAGVVQAGSFNGFGENYLLRGFQQQDLFKDGFRAGHTSNIGFSATGPTDVANLERIEILKGPAAILYGRGEPGGIVNYISRAPYFADGISLEQQFGSYDFYRTELDANWNALPKTLALRLDAAYETANSFIDFVNGERFFVAPSLLWQIDSKTALIFRGEYSHDSGLPSPGLPYVDAHVLPGVPYGRFLGEPDFSSFDIDSFRGLLSLEHGWTEDIVTTLSAHGRVSSNDTNYVNIVNFDTGIAVDPVTGLISRESVIGDTDNDNEIVRLDQVFNWTIYEGVAAETVARDAKDGKAVVPAPRRGFPTVKNQLLISLEYERQADDNFSIFNALPPLNAYDPVYTGYDPQPLVPGFPLDIPEAFHTTAESYSVLVMDRVAFGDIAYLSFGGRLEQFDAHQKDALAPDIFGPGTDVDTDQLTFNPSAGLVVKPSRASSVYFSYAESTNSFNNLSAITASGDTIDPEESRGFELGAKVGFLENRLLITAALFQINKENVAAPDPENSFFSTNAGEQRSCGFEFELNGEPVPGWRISLGYAYTDARIVDAPLGVNVGNRFYGVPYNSGGLFSTYEFQSGPLKGLGFGGGVFASDKVQVTNGNIGQLPGWAQADLAVFYQRGRFRVQLNVKNLFDEHYYYARNDENVVQPAAARTIVGAISLKF